MEDCERADSDEQSDAPPTNRQDEVALPLRIDEPNDFVHVFCTIIVARVLPQASLVVLLFEGIYVVGSSASLCATLTVPRSPNIIPKQSRT